MTAGQGHALEQALAYYRAPAMLPVAAERPLPDDVLVLLRLAAGDSAVAGQCASTSGETEGTVVDAAVFFVQQVLFAPGADSYRVLGVNPDAPQSRIKEHYRWLVRWLHPDRNQDDWDTVYADRVTRAWQELRRGGSVPAAESMPAYRAATPPPGGMVSAVPLRPRIAADHGSGPLVSARTLQRLPAIVLGGLGVLAAVTLALMWYAQTTPLRSPRLAAPLTEAAADPAGVGLEDDSSATLPGPVATELAAVAPTPGVAPMEPPVATPAGLASELAEPWEQPSAPLAPRRDPEPAPPATVAATSPRTAAGRDVGAAARPAAGAVEPRKTLPRASAATETAAVAAAEPSKAAAGIRSAGETVDPGTAEVLMRRFVDAYVAGDINGLMVLFSRDARNNRGGRDAIVYDYQSLFSRTSRRELALESNGWVERADGATLLARYRAKVKQRQNLLANDSRGDIRFDLVQEDGQLKIARVLFTEAED